jgi:anti-sigma factor RsiW
VTCHDVRDRLSAWRDGEAAGRTGLSSDERAAIARHLDECPSCREALARFERSVSILRELPSPTAPWPVTMRAMALGRRHADEMSEPQQKVAARVASVAEPEPAVRYASATHAAPAPAPMEFRSSERPPRFRVVLFIALGLIALTLLALTLGFQF